VFVGYLGWRLGFNYGSHQSNDSLLTSPAGNTEVAHLRAQLVEARTFQETLLNVVLASFAAGFTLLVLVNVGVIVLAQRNYERDERAIRSVLTSETNEKIQAEATRADNALATRERELSHRFDERIRAVTDQLASEKARVNSNLIEMQGSILGLNQDIGSLQSSTLQNLSRLEIESWKSAAFQAEATGRYLDAAELYSKITVALGADRWVGALSLMHNVPPILRNLSRADLPGYLSREDLAVIKEALTLASNHESILLGVDPQQLADSLARVDSEIEQAPEIPPPRMPPVAPAQS
jgi:hypothetical protein